AAPKLTRNIIQITSRYQRLPAREIKTMFEQGGIYADQPAWAKFIDIALLSIGLAFLTAGTIFFFAYNWQELHKFAKLGIAGALIVIGIAATFFTSKNVLISNILLTGTSVLVGLLFSVFGQIYQTGADAYDFFLGWTLFIFLWAIVADFAPLWLMLILLINMTFSLYIDQTGPDWPTSLICLTLFSFNTAALILIKLLGGTKLISVVPDWFSKAVALLAVFLMTASMVSGIFASHAPELWVIVPVACLSYAAGVYYSVRQHSLYLLCIMPLSVLVMLTALFFQHVHWDGIFMTFFAAMFIIGTVTVLIRQLLKLNKTWNGNS
ncbi:MAG TPA: DUF2157 domain-containing protein, partial [Pedobacter sp.]|nr:DUF2157 domain-containing protein [Pedobacter sp.]